MASTTPTAADLETTQALMATLYLHKGLCLCARCENTIASALATARMQGAREVVARVREQADLGSGRGEVYGRVCVELDAIERELGAEPREDEHG